MIVNGTWLIALAAMMIVTAKAEAPKCWSARSGMSGVATPSDTARGRYERNQRSLDDGRSLGRVCTSVDLASRWRARAR
jgi:hypothetical protein